MGFLGPVKSGLVERLGVKLDPRVNIANRWLAFLKPVIMGESLIRLRDFPEDVRANAGCQLEVVQEA